MINVYTTYYHVTFPAVIYKEKGDFMKLQYYPEGETEDLDENKIMTRKPYIKPAIVNEFELETRAGSPLNVDPMDPNTWEAPNW